MVRHLDELVRRGDLAPAALGSLDGYAGLTRRGDPTRLIVSEWALADAAPLEFLRRAAASELLHLEPSYLADRSRGRVAVLADCGPDQLGAARLVQLATLVVLIARAIKQGTDVTLGVLGDEPGTWLTGPVERVLDAWLRARRGTRPNPNDIPAWADDLNAPDELWVLTAPDSSGTAGARRPQHHIVTATECAWTEHGAAAVDVAVDGRHAELALPHGDIAVHALRGVLVRSVDRTRDLTLAATGTIEFSGARPMLLIRANDPSVVAVCEVRTNARVKHHHFAGRVLRAAPIGRRIVALVIERGEIRARVIGKHLGRIHELAVPDTFGHLDTERIGPLVYSDGALLTELDGVWWRLGPHPDQAETDADVVAVRPDVRTDCPVVARRTGGLVTFNHTRSSANAPTSPDDLVLGSGDRFAVREGDGSWRLSDGRAIALDVGERPLGLHLVDDAPALVTVSAAGLIIRLRWPAGVRALTTWSGGAGVPAVHPTLPLIAVRRDDGRIDLGDLTTGEVVTRIGAP